MKKVILILLCICSLLTITVFAAELKYTALYVGSNKAYVNDVEQQIDKDNPAVEVFGVIGDVPVFAHFGY